MKNTLNRRQFLKLASAMTALAAVPRAVGAATTAPRVVVVGGGFGGATLAKYLRMWGGNVDVTLVDPNPTHYSCILSNLVVTGALPMSRINLAFDPCRPTRCDRDAGRRVRHRAAGNKLTVSTISGNLTLTLRPPGALAWHRLCAGWQATGTRV